MPEYYSRAHGEYRENPAIDAFLADIRAACTKHGLVIVPDDLSEPLRITRLFSEATWKFSGAIDDTDDTRTILN